MDKFYADKDSFIVFIVFSYIITSILASILYCVNPSNVNILLIAKINLSLVGIGIVGGIGFCIRVKQIESEETMDRLQYKVYELERKLRD